MTSYCVGIVFVILIDRSTKWLVVNKMDIAESIPIIENFFYITSHRNEGVAWGLLQGQMGMFYFIKIVVVIGLVYLLYKYNNESNFMAIFLSLFFAVEIGIFIYRILVQSAV